MRIRVRILAFVLFASVASSAQNPGRDEAAPPEQKAKLLQAEQLADSAMKRLHQTFDFEPILTDMLALDVVEAWRKELPGNIDIRDVVRLYGAGLSAVYLMPLLQVSLKMNGVNLKSHEQLPPDVKATTDSLNQFAATMDQIFSDRLFSTTPEQLHELIRKAQDARLTMLKHIRPDAWKSEAYKEFLKGYPDESRIESESDSDVKDMESVTGAQVKGQFYIVRREGLAFMMVESGGVIKIAGVAPVWID